MIIEKKLPFLNQLKKIVLFIGKDKPSVALNFEKELNQKINLILSNPRMYRKSNYFDDERYRDLIFKGYTIIYKIDEDIIKILDIFKWQNR